MRSKTYYPIVWHQDWHSCDKINGVALQEGSKIEIKWPIPVNEEDPVTESVLSTHEIKIIRETHVVSDMGHPYECTDDISEVTIDHNNAKVVMRLRNTKEIRARIVE